MTMVLRKKLSSYGGDYRARSINARIRAGLRKFGAIRRQQQRNAAELLQQLRSQPDKGAE